MFTALLYYCNSVEEAALIDVLYALDFIVDVMRYPTEESHPDFTY